MNHQSGCPSSFTLMRFALTREEPEAGLQAHVTTCPLCQEAIARERALGQSYMSSPAAQALRRQLDDMDRRDATRTRPPRARVWAWSGGLAAAASLLLVVSLASRDGGFTSGDLTGSGSGVRPKPSSSAGTALTPKGGPHLSLWIGEGEETSVELGEAPVLRPGQRVQPVFGTPTAGFVALFVTTPGGQVRQIYPASGAESAPLPAQPPGPLGPSFRLDEETGRYAVRIYFADSSFATEELSAHALPEKAPSFAGLVLTRSFEVRP